MRKKHIVIACFFATIMLLIPVTSVTSYVNNKLIRETKDDEPLVSSISSVNANVQNKNNLNMKNSYPFFICVYLWILGFTYGVIETVALSFWATGKISGALMQKIYDYTHNRARKLYNLAELLNCPWFPWDFPKNKLDEIINHKLNYKYDIIESSLNNTNFSLSNCNCQKNLNKSYFSFNNLMLCSLLFIPYKLLIMKFPILKPIVEKLDIKILTIIYNLLVIQRFYRKFNLAEQLECDWLDNID